MPQGLDEQTGRLYYRANTLAKGMNLALSKRTLTEIESSSMYNVLSRFGMIIPSSQKSVLKWTLTEDIYYQFIYDIVASQKYVMMGTTKCWVYTSTSPTEKTPATPFTNSAPIWKGATLMHNSLPVAVVTNFGNDYPHYYDGGAGLFVPLTNAPKARTFCGYLRRMFVGNVYDAGGSVWKPNRIQWTGFTDLTHWDYATYPSAGYLDLDDNLDPIYDIEITSGNVLVVFRRKSVYVCYPGTLAENPIYEQYNNNHGLFAPNTVQRVGDAFYYWGEDDVYRFTTDGGSVSIGAKVRNEILSLYNPTYVLHAWSFIDILNKEYYLIIRVADVNQNPVYRAFVYNYEQDSWSAQDFENYLSLGVWYA